MEWKYFRRTLKNIMKNSYITALMLIVALGAKAQHVSTFTSVNPVDIQDSYITIPPTHAFQLLFHSGDALTEGGEVGTWSDFTGFVPVSGSSTEGRLCVNSEFVPGGVSIHDLEFNATTNLWDITASGGVDFSAFNCLIAGGTVANCSGGITPWGTMVTCEENTESFICSYEGYKNFGWNVEIDPVTRTVIDQNNSGTPDKLWAMGRMKHENVCFTADSLISYFGDDNSASGYLYKFVMAQKANLSEGDLFVYVLNEQTLNGQWVQVPNTTVDNRNNTISISQGLGATPYDRIEDVEIGPDGKIYFASTGADRIYRLNQDGSSFEVYADNIDVTIAYEGGTKTVRFDSPDNLCFDNLGNLWVNQDGGNNYLWVIDADHTLASPKVRMFANTPKGCESTGITFTPDFRYMFLSIQHPDATNAATQTDAADQNVVFSKDATLVIARSEYLGAPSRVADAQIFDAQKCFVDMDGRLFSSFISRVHGQATVEVVDMAGHVVRTTALPVHIGLNNFHVNMNGVAKGAHVLRVALGDRAFSTKFVR
jgi:hypothetical protein